MFEVLYTLESSIHCAFAGRRKDEERDCAYGVGLIGVPISVVQGKQLGPKKPGLHVHTHPAPAIHTEFNGFVDGHAKQEETSSPREKNPAEHGEHLREYEELIAKLIKRFGLHQALTYSLPRTAIGLISELSAEGEPK